MAVSPRVRLIEYLANKYKLTIGDYDELLRRQNGTCAVCHQPPKPRQRLHVDHDHETGVVRALLCAGCNTALGIMGENPLLLYDLMLYAEHCVQARTRFAPDAGDRDRSALAAAFERDPASPYVVNAMREALLRVYAKPAKPATRAPWETNLMPVALGTVAPVRAGDAGEAVFV